MSLATKLTPINKLDDIGISSRDDLNLHNCLTDDADWNSEFWDFYPDCTDNIAEKIKNGYMMSSEGVRFQALWVGDKPKLTIELTIEELLATLKSNRVRTRATYIVRKNA